MNHRIFILVFILWSVTAWAQQPATHMQTHAPAKPAGAKPATTNHVAMAHPVVEHPVTMMAGLGNLHHPVSTQNVGAQNFFDQGLRLIYAFNHEEAARSFQHAAELDPKLGMAYWGVAEAVGPNYNDPADPERYRKAHDAIQKAVELSANAPAQEQAYIQALAKRFPADPKADLRKAAEEYRDAMRGVMQQFPDDLDAATLFAEAGMNLHPWGLWHPDGIAEAGTEEIVATLESVIRRDPNHLGALHYYIHAVEASPTPERALAAANRLAALAPGAGHIVHMPAHVYIRTGDFSAAVKTNEKAVAVDESYIKSNSVQGVYPMMYYSHNLHFIAMCSAMEGNYLEAKSAADKLAAHAMMVIKEMPPLEAFLTIPISVQIRFHRWDDILKMPQPDASMQATTFFWHFSRGLAFAGTGKVADAENEYKAVVAAEQATPADVIFAPPVQNKLKDILKIAENILAGEIARAKGDNAQAIAKLRDAVAVEDTLNYNEPKDWFYPVRESLGAELMATGDAAGAEKVFREDLVQNPRNPRSLFGLREALKAQKKDYAAGFVDKQLATAWKGAAPLKMEDLI